MKAMHSTQLALKSILIMTLIVIALQINPAYAERYVCQVDSNDEATCEVDYQSDKDNLIAFLCQAGPGQAAVKKTCSAIYTPIQGYTYTGLPGRNWTCESAGTFTHAEFADKKALCSKLCGPCSGGWQSK